jgi:hypothetical protein
VHPPTAIFIFAMAYLLWGIIENTILLAKRRKLKQIEQQSIESKE